MPSSPDAAPSPGPGALEPSTSRRRPPARVSGREREAAILATLQQRLSEQPWHTLSVDDLARGAGISRTTFYFYFASKEAALHALLERLVPQAWEILEGAPELLPQGRAEAWRRAIGGYCEAWMANRDVIRAAAEARATSPEINGLWTRLLDGFVDYTAGAIESERDCGAAPPGLPARELALCLNRMNERILETLLGEGDPTLGEDRVVDALVDVWLRAIYGTPPVPGPDAGR